jgi:hypothetical protein
MISFYLLEISCAGLRIEGNWQDNLISAPVWQIIRLIYVFSVRVHAMFVERLSALFAVVVGDSSTEV